MVTLLGILLLLTAQKQTAPSKFHTFESVISKIPWDAAKDGPLIAVCPDLLTEGSDLESINRKRVRVGKLTLIVPATRVSINSTFQNPVDFYDGLPMEAKILYLVTVANPGELSKLTGEGLTIGDCNGESQAVMQSILPNPVRYRQGELTTASSITYPWGSDFHTLPKADRSKVRLRVFRELRLLVSLLEDGGVKSVVVDLPKKGALVKDLEESEKEYGQKIRVEVENLPLKSQLDYSDHRLERLINLEKRESVGSLFKRIQSATGIELYAADRFVNQVVLEFGGQAKASDILRGVAYGVAGTYRRLASCYVLTNDIQGMATHQARIAAFEDDIKGEIEDRVNNLKYAIAQKGLLNRIRFNGPAYKSLTKDELENLRMFEANQPGEISTQSASSVVLKAMRNPDNFYWKPVDTSKVSLQSAIRSEFIYPDGSRSGLASWLGETNNFALPPKKWKPPEPEPINLPFASTAKLPGFLVALTDGRMARPLVQQATELGLKEVWIETRNPDILIEAVKAGREANVLISLAIRPWDLSPRETVADLNKTITGDHGNSLREVKHSYRKWLKYWPDNCAFEPPTPELISPVDPSIPSRWIKFEKLAATPGLSHITVLDAYPTGYALSHSGGSSGGFYSKALDNFVSYGNSEGQRLAFLRKTGADPLDIEDKYIRTTVSLEEAWGDFRAENRIEEWIEFRGKLCKNAVAELLQKLASAAPNCPISVDGQPTQLRSEPFGANMVQPWMPGQALPTHGSDIQGGRASLKCDFQFYRILEDDDLAQINRVAYRIWMASMVSPKPCILDLSGVPLSHMQKVLRFWVRKAKPGDVIPEPQ